MLNDCECSPRLGSGVKGAAFRSARTVELVEFVHANAFDSIGSLVRDEAEAARLARVRVAHYHAIDHIPESTCRSEGGGGGGGEGSCG